MVHLVMCAAIFSMVTAVVTVASVGATAIFVVMAVFVVCAASMSSKIVIIVLIVVSVVSRFGAMVGADVVVSRFFVVVVSFFVSGTLFKKHGNYSSATSFAM